MRPNGIPLSVIAAALSACVVEPELLNSERIETRFGSYGIDVIAYGESLRRSNLYSEENGLRTCRTYAVVRFEGAAGYFVGDEHARILDGQSIGETFRSTGWDIYKETLHIGQIPIERDHPIAALMRLRREMHAAMHVYRLLLRKQDTVIEYATIIEVHHPEYLDTGDLDKLFAPEVLPANRPEVGTWKALVLGEG